MHLFPNGILSPGGGVCARMMPLSKLFSSRVCSVTPQHFAPEMMVCWSGAGPRNLIGLVRMKY